MSFRSPWRHRSYVVAVAGLRRLLRPWPGADMRLVEVLVTAQNRRVRRHLAGRPPRTVLLILPRCVKKSGCCADVQADLGLCRDCADCQLGGIARLCDRHGVRALVAFRSHIAFAMARRESPDLIIATACHDRLIKALRSVPEHPALLVPLAGMDRMCVNASIDLAWFEAQLASVAQPVAAGTPAAAPGETDAAACRAALP
ncbi:MAG TPA: DUF116 domain-containing protein [Candidatus Krumholzibacteria bacterium]|nr:DUF116 domain-containing protein [Candidatus Krumholzibacteria bacterium]